MIRSGEPRRKFLFRLGLLFSGAAAVGLRAQQTQNPRSRVNPDKPAADDEASPFPPGSRQAALEENEKDIKKKVEKLFQLATELKDEVDKTNSAKVLSLALLKKADEIEKLAKDIKTRAKG
jgi:flagellar motility protein MotE (MotC chaperone)